MANLYGLSDSVLGEGIYKSDPIGSFNFILTVEGMYDIPLKAVRSFQKVNQYEKIKEGGVNDYVHLKRAPIQDAHTIQFERYLTASLVDPLANGAELAMPVILWLKRAANNGLTDVRVDQMKNGSASKKTYSDNDYDTSSVRLYIFTGCVVMSKEYGALDAEKSGLVTEVVTMAYKELYIVPNLYTFFGGGTDLKSLGKTGELTSVDENARKEFLEKQQEEYKSKVAEHASKATRAKIKEDNERKQFETKQEEEYKSKVAEHASKATREKIKEDIIRKQFEEKQQQEHKSMETEHASKAAEADKKQKTERAAFETRQHEEHDHMEISHTSAAAKAENKQREQRKAYEKKQKQEYDAAVAEHKEAAKKAEEQADKDRAEWEEKQKITPQEAKDQRAKANAEQSSLEKANQIRNKAKKNK